MLTFALFAFPDRPNAHTWAFHAAQRLVEEGAGVYLEEQLSAAAPPDLLSKVSICSIAELGKFADIVITFGGDGTLLAAAHVLIGTDVPIMGVNVGKLGFLAEYPVAKLDDGIMELLKGDYRIVDRTTIETEWEDQTACALNEIVVERSAGAKILTIRTFVNDHLVADFRSDGVLVSTPTGSTAYSLAAGGPIIAPSANVFCLTAISPHTLTVRPLIVSDTSQIRFELPESGSDARIVADGRVVGVMKQKNSLTIRRSNHLLKLVKQPDNTYFDLLREKLLWSADGVKKS
ncbi:MAG: NAD(+) kinase [Chlorobi bacterium]|nr:MAG: NAD(+) kinase [Bacteroidota bacterium]KXK34085.1 MAG: NAD(+) kinase [Chlorobi bacterium OLB6]MBE2265116.1 NAD(+)/NADH kinase [Flavobacteriales bacterium]MBL1161367.1 NAD(+) kinase [Chlorobiota bacterium]MBW7852654.1 NAD(+)/NADH kinase [Candidatus Kapabacteria bacterium]MCC6331086.1 NAD(+)/NADH kinase [Ignavibacteria bacterium]